MIDRLIENGFGEGRAELDFRFGGALVVDTVGDSFLVGSGEEREDDKDNDEKENGFHEVSLM